MADKQVLGLEVPAQVINSYKDLKAAVKDAQDQQAKAAIQFGTDSEQFKKASKNVADLKDKIEDLNDSSKSLKGSGIERSAQGFQQLGEGLRNLDFDKVKVGLTAIKSALAATGIMLIVQGFMYLIENFEKLSEGSGLLAKALKTVGDILNTIKDGVYAVTDAIGLTNSELDKQGEAIKTYSDKTTEALQSQTKEFDNQIKVARAAGKETVDLEIAKQEAIVNTNKAIVEQIIAYVRAGGQLDDEKKKQLTASLQLIKDAKTEEKVIELNHQKEISDEWHKNNDKRIEDEKARQELLNATKFEAKIAADDIEYEQELAQQDRLNELKKQKEEESQATSLAISAELTEKKLEQDKKATAEEIQLEREKAQQKQEITSKSLQAAQALSDMFFSAQLRQAKGNAEREKEIKKKQFNINKAFGITTAVIDGVRSVQSALTQTPPLSYVLAALNAALAIANVAKIASAKFDDGGTSSGGSGDMGGSIGSSASGAPPPIANPSNTVDTTKFGEGGKNLEMTPPKAQVVETEITSKQKIVTKMEGQAVF